MRAHQARGSRNGRSIIKAAEQLDLHANHMAAAGDHDAPGVATVAQRRPRTTGGENRRFCTRSHLKDSKPRMALRGPCRPRAAQRKKRAKAELRTHPGKVSERTMGGWRRRAGSERKGTRSAQ
jgi:hypothetical protein